MEESGLQPASEARVKALLTEEGGAQVGEEKRPTGPQEQFTEEQNRRGAFQRGGGSEPRRFRRHKLLAVPRPSVAGRRHPHPGRLDHISKSHFDGVAARVPLTPEEGENEDKGHPAEPAIDEARSADRCVRRTWRSRVFKKHRAETEEHEPGC